jgi:hypothetical protein
MNPSKSKLIESSEIFCLTNQIHDTNLLKNVLQIESTIWIFCKKLYKLNLQYKSLRFGFASLPAWIRKDSFCAIVLRIGQDLWGFLGFVKTGQIFGSSGHKTNPRFKSSRIRLVNPDSRIQEVGIINHNTKQTFLESGFVTTIWNKSMDLQNESMFLQISYMIPASLQLILVWPK